MPAHGAAAIPMILSLALEEQKSQKCLHMKKKTLRLILIALFAYFRPHRHRGDFPTTSEAQFAHPADSKIGTLPEHAALPTRHAE